MLNEPGTPSLYLFDWLNVLRFAPRVAPPTHQVPAKASAKFAVDSFGSSLARDGNVVFVFYKLICPLRDGEIKNDRRLTRTAVLSGKGHLFKTDHSLRIVIDFAASGTLRVQR